MRWEFGNLLRCPACGAQLHLQNEAWQGEEVWFGTLICTGCNEHYAIIEGIPHLYVDDESWAPIQREADGWVELHKEMGIYETTQNAIDLKTPYYDEAPWIAIGQAFDIAMKELALEGNERILDLGAGRAWAAKQFALKGCQAVATDIVADSNVGLGRAYALMEASGTRFDLLIADANKLPLLPESFDVVFCCGVLHHADSLESFLVNIARVLKPGGRLCAVSEPCIAFWQDESRLLRQTASEELAHGINEHLPRLSAYLNACGVAGLCVRQALPSNLWTGEDTDWVRVAQAVGASWGGLHPGQPLRSLRSVAYFAARRLAAAFRGRLPAPRPIWGQDAATVAQENILNWCGGELLLLAEKEAS